MFNRFKIRIAEAKSMQPIDFHRTFSPRFFKDLPIFQKRDELISAIRSNQILVIAGETASGKSTQLPLLCFEAGRARAGRIAVTQPRRIAAVSLAVHLSEFHRRPLGESIGYKIRFDEKLSEQTAILFMTDGILLTEIPSDPLLKKYDTIIVDEAHERSLNIDFLLGYLRKIVPKRPDLRVIISSATIDTTLFARAFEAPVIEVSGRLFPVDTWYMPPRQNEKTADRSYVEAAADAVTELVELGEQGDILVFMPAERDILETQEKLVGRRLYNSIVLPLFGRLSRSRQHRIFEPSAARKIVIATNVAETSITVPGIRFVVDTGLARISRYAPRLRTSRLPIEPISRASADQRKGRCGRMRDGVCIRLYAEEDYLGRDEFTDPEIKRSNLAGVILQMQSMRLGPIERFGFLEPPDDRAVRDGYALLTELGALDQKRRLTGLGRAMARLPLDPHVSRMVLEARRSNTLREMIIIAAGLSIVDPRERPPEQQDQADAKQKPFVDPGSDFNTYVRLWDAYQDQWRALKSQSGMRRFCREHFLSYNRFREWHDVHDQIFRLVRGRKDFAINQRPAAHEEIHRAVLSGLLTNVAVKKEEGNAYRAAHGREIYLFPGSALFDKKPQWIVCHEIVETSRVYARTVAPIKPEWLEELARRLMRYQYADPAFNEQSGIVEAMESGTLFGLPVVNGRRVNFGRINPTCANAIFIQEGLVAERLKTRHRFFSHNRVLRERLGAAEEKTRTRGIVVDDDAVAAFYRERIPRVASIHDLNREIREHGGDDFLTMTENDLLATTFPDAVAAFPDSLTIGGKNFPLRYAFEPGAAHDGVTAEIPASSIPYLSDQTFGWLVKPLWREKIYELLTQLPKTLRKQLAPLKQRADELSAAMEYSPEPFTQVLARDIQKRYGVRLDAHQFDENRLPDFLRLRLAVKDEKNRTIHAARSLEEIKQGREVDSKDTDWQRLFRAHERRGLTSWDFEALPERIEAGASSQGFPLYGYPALKDAGERVDCILCTSAEDAARIHRQGIRKLTELTLSADWAWEEKEVKFSAELKMQCAPFGGAERVRRHIFDSMRAYAFDCHACPRSKETFDRHLATARERLKGLGFRTLSLVGAVFREYQLCEQTLRARQRTHASPLYAPVHKQLNADCAAYIERFTSQTIRWTMLSRYPDYFRALRLQIERAYADPGKYRSRIAPVAAWRDRATELGTQKAGAPFDKRLLIAELEEMVEEFAIHQFAQQEIKTRYPISEKRLEKKLARIENQG